MELLEAAWCRSQSPEGAGVTGSGGQLCTGLDGLVATCFPGGSRAGGQFPQTRCLIVRERPGPSCDRAVGFLGRAPRRTSGRVLIRTCSSHEGPLWPTLSTNNQAHGDCSPRSRHWVKSGGAGEGPREGAMTRRHLQDAQQDVEGPSASH